MHAKKTGARKVELQRSGRKWRLGGELSDEGIILSFQQSTARLIGQEGNQPGMANYRERSARGVTERGLSVEYPVGGRTMRWYRRVRAFTLIELLVVIAIIAILAAILFPV